MSKLVLIGAGAQGNEVVQLVRDINRSKQTWDIIGFLDDSNTKVGQSVNDIKVIGTVDQIHEVVDDDTYVFCSIGQSESRQQVINRILKSKVKYNFATLIHPSAIVADDVIINEGSQVSALTFVSTNTLIERFVLINYGCTIGHDCTLRDFATIAPGCRLSGNVNVGTGSEIGSGVSIIQNVSIGYTSIIGAGATVISDLPDLCTAVGVPARVIKYRV